MAIVTLTALVQIENQLQFIVKMIGMIGTSAFCWDCDVKLSAMHTNAAGLPFSCGIREEHYLVSMYSPTLIPVSQCQLTNITWGIVDVNSDCHTHM